MMDHRASIVRNATLIRPPGRRGAARRGLAVLVAGALLLGSAPAQDGERQRRASGRATITAGTATPAPARTRRPRNQPRQHEQQSPGRYETGNFGRSGATLLRTGEKAYWDQDVFARGCEFGPSLVVINLGTNDATAANWRPPGDAFEKDLRDLIETYRGLPSRPRIWLSNLTPMYEPFSRIAECEPNRVVIERTIQQVANEHGLPVIDLETPTSGKPELFPDGLHPNTAGNELLAQAVFTAITGEQAPRDDTIRPARVENVGMPHMLVEGGKARAVRLGSWTQRKDCVEGTGKERLLLATVGIGDGDFHLRANLRMQNQQNSAAGFVLNENFFGFEGARGTVFRNGPQMGGIRMLHPAGLLWQRDAWIRFEVIRNGELVWFVVDGFVVDMAIIPGPIERFGFDPMRSTMQVKEWSIVGKIVERRPEHMDRRTVQTPWIDLANRSELRSFPDEPGATPRREIERRLALLVRNGKDRLRFGYERSKAGNSQASISRNEGRTWSDPFELPAVLTGDGHRATRLPDDTVMVTFVDGHATSPTSGDFVAWVGTWEDLIEQREGRFTCRLADLPESYERLLLTDIEVRPHGTIVAYATWSLHAALGHASAAVQFTLPRLHELLPTRGYTIPVVDLDADENRHVVVDREEGQYLGHVSTELLEDGRTILAVYPKGHGRGAIVYKRSTDGGRTWSERLPTPANWATSQEVPTIHRVIDPKTGKKRLILWSGLHPARLAVSEDDGASWSELAPVGDWGGIVVMGFVERLANGSYLAMFHDDGRFFTKGGKQASPRVMTLYKTFSHDGGLSWTFPEVVYADSEVHLCEPGCVRSPDGATLAVLLRENSRTRNSYVIFSRDEGRSWSSPRELPASLTGDRHTAAYAPDGRLFICFRDTAHESPTQGDWCGWVGTWEDILYGRQGQYRVRLKDNRHGWDTTYPGVEALPDGTFVVTTYGHWDEGEQPYILSARFTLAELDAVAERLPRKTSLFERGTNGVHTYRIPALVTTNEGTLIACCDARNESSRDLPNNIDTVIRRSTDGGETWSNVTITVDWEGSEGTADPCLLVDRTTGRIWCAVTWADGVGWHDSEPGLGRDSFRNLLVHSDDDGVTWSPPVDVTAQLKDPAWRSTWFGPGAGLQTASGRLLLPYSAADMGRTQHSCAAVSDDHGKTWRRVGPIGRMTNECMIAELGDGRLVCNMRSTRGLARRALSFSADDGETWSELAHDDALVEPTCQASLLTIPAARTPDGRRWLVFCNPASTKRQRLALKVSFDDGATWSVERVLHAGPAAYSCMALLPGGGIGVLYERGVESPYEGIGFAAVPLPWLAADGGK